MSEGSYNCRETLRDIERFLDGEMETDPRSLLERHLAECPPCTDRAEFSRHLKVMIGSKCRGDVVPSELMVRIRLMIREHHVHEG